MTNIIVLDSERNVIQDQRVVVQRDEASLVNLHKGNMRQSFSCTPTRSPTLTIGDDSQFFEMVSSRFDENELLDGAGGGGGAPGGGGGGPVTRSSGVTIHSDYAKSRGNSIARLFCIRRWQSLFRYKSLLTRSSTQAVGGRDDPVPLSERKEILALSRCCLADSCELRLVASGAR